MPRRHRQHPHDPASIFTRLEEVVVARSGEDVFEESLKLLALHLFAEDRTSEEALVAFDRRVPGVLAEPRLRLTPEAARDGRAVLAAIVPGDLAALDLFFEALVSHLAKASKGQYFTPRHVVECCVRIVAPTTTARILDPACGSGAFLLAAARHGVASGNLFGIDIDPRAVRIARFLAAAAGERLDVRHGDALDRTVLGGQRFDCILTNPPFAGDVRDAELLSQFELARHQRRIERDLLFLERCTELLAPGGTLCIVLPHNVFAGRRTAAVRAWLFERLRVLAVVGLGRTTFLPHTHQKANVLFARRRRAHETHAGEKIFFAQSERDDARDHDLFEIAQAYLAFAAEAVPA
ncbi:MAG: SAM-dependent DNA methyltransferase [Candidatus Eremiobacteraeota bacterium]|nr:SAM-dependent DNA methyltransferase [Candidatus Eremiobacteraeota bacterium]